jgi:hypothetical protein
MSCQKFGDSTSSKLLIAEAAEDKDAENGEMVEHKLFSATSASFALLLSAIQISAIQKGKPHSYYSLLVSKPASRHQPMAAIIPVSKSTFGS